MTDTPFPQSSFYTVPQVAEFLKVSPETVFSWIERRDLTVHVFGTHYRILDYDLTDFIILKRVNANHE